MQNEPIKCNLDFTQCYSCPERKDCSDFLKKAEIRSSGIKAENKQYRLNL
jgi:hypothetical protein